MKSVFWVNKTNLTKEAIDALYDIIPDMKLVQLSEVSQDRAEGLLMIADIVAFQKSSLPPDLERLIKSRPSVIEHEIDFNFNFVKWSWYKWQVGTCLQDAMNVISRVTAQKMNLDGMMDVMCVLPQVL